MFSCWDNFSRKTPTCLCVGKRQMRLSLIKEYTVNRQALTVWFYATCHYDNGWQESSLLHTYSNSWWQTNIYVKNSLGEAVNKFHYTCEKESLYCLRALGNQRKYLCLYRFWLQLDESFLMTLNNKRIQINRIANWWSVRIFPLMCDIEYDIEYGRETEIVVTDCLSHLLLSLPDGQINDDIEYLHRLQAYLLQCRIVI